MSISYKEICTYLETYNKNGYKKVTGGRDYVTIAPENYTNLHIYIQERKKNKIKIYFEIVNRTAKKNQNVQSFCESRYWEPKNRDGKIERYTKTYKEDFSFNSIEEFEEEITAAQDFIKEDFNEIKKIVPAGEKNSESKGQKNKEYSVFDSRQVIYFGAPGTGKSHNLKEDANKFTKNQERVTFYPGYSYQQFVGTYKPFIEDKNKISYKFVPGPLLRLLVDALKTKNDAVQNQEPEKFLLIVEELNRAEAAAVFGDLFQLLDRDNDGNSEYPISVSEDLKQYLIEKGVWIKEETLSFPSNFYIWATMNSADQGVFPLDTAFKRRWDFRYFGIDDAANGLKEGVPQFWNVLRKAINNALHENLNLNEDKLLGPFFIKLEENIDEKTFWERFCSKVLLYLYEDAARLNRNRIFQNKITYSKMFAKFVKFHGSEEKWQEELEKVWNTVFTFDIKLEFDQKINYPWAKSENKVLTDATDDGEAAEDAVTENRDANNEQ